MKDFAGAFHGLIADELGDFHGTKTQWRNVPRVDGIRVHHHGLSEIDRLEKSVTEALVVAWVGDEIRMGIDIEQSVDVLAVRSAASFVPHPIRNESHVNPGVLDALTQELHVIAAFVAGRM